jgi:tetratricopeptide (TPR) repeat protein
MIHFELGNQSRELGDLDAALEHHQKARELLGKALGERHPHMVITLATLARTLQARGDDARALALFEEAHALGSEVEVRPDDLARVAVELGALTWELRPAERDRARGLVETAVPKLPEGGDDRREAQRWLDAHASKKTP